MIWVAALAMATQSLAEMRDHRRVLVVTAASEADPSLSQQRRALADWRAEAADRDVTVVEVIGSHVIGASDPATTLRRRLELPDRDFTVVLVGKDGHIALRSSAPLTSARLDAAIDAMPMRRAGLR